MRDWPQMEQEDDPTGQKEKINKSNWKKFPREGLESLARGFPRSACSDPAFGALL